MEKLPDEILLSIFDFVNPPIKHFTSPWASQRLQDLFSLSLVCKRLNPIATGLLYVAIEERSSRNSIKIYRFMRTMRSHPDFLKCLESLRFKFHPDARLWTLCGENQPRRAIKRPWFPFKEVFSDDDDNDDDDEITAKSDTSNKSVQDELYTAETSWLVTEIKRLASRSKLQNPYEVFHATHYQEDVLLASCILRAPNLQRLWYQMRYNSYENTRCLLLPFISYVALGAIHSKHHAFKKLQVLHIDIANSGFEFPLAHALPLLLLESLQELTLGGWGTVDRGRMEGWDIADPRRNHSFPPANDDSTVFGRPWGWPLRASSIARLSLVKPLVSVAMIVKMIHACKALSRFELVGHHSEKVVLDKSFYEQIGTALCEQADSLTEICIGDPWDGFGRRAQAGSLHTTVKMTKVTSIRAPLNILMGRTKNSSLCDAIPPTIEHLWLELPYEIPSNLSSQFLDIHQLSLQGAFPHLKSIKLSWVRDQRRSSIESILDLPFDFNGLRILFKPSPISFDLSIFCYFDKVPTPKERQELADLFPGGVNHWGSPFEVEDEEDNDHTTEASTCATRPLADFEEDERIGYYLTHLKIWPRG